jgi:hypothetical protein
MKIEILGVGCPKCKQLTVNAEAALKELGICAEISKVTEDSQDHRIWRDDDTSACG